jgi:thiol-disulfide isomerase/thioredoxin
MRPFKVYGCLGCPRRFVPGLVAALVGILGFLLITALLARLPSLFPRPSYQHYSAEQGGNPPAEAWQYSPPKFKVGEVAPDFLLTDLEGKTFELCQEADKTPLVLEFGSFTCQFCSNQFSSMEDLAQKYAGRVQFVLVYCREAHPDPSGTSALDRNGSFPEGLPQTTGRAQRAERASAFRDFKQGSVRRLLVDEEGDHNIQERFGAFPSQVFVVGSGRRIIWSGSNLPISPLKFTLPDLERCLQLLIGKTPLKSA